MRSKDQILLEDAYQKILLNNIVKESHSEKHESDSEKQVDKSEKNSDDDKNSDDESEEESKNNSNKKGEYVKSENFVHGIQPISEAKNKSVNPYAVCTATVGRKDEEKYKSCKKKVAAGAKKSGKKVTTKSVKKK